MFELLEDNPEAIALYKKAPTSKKIKMLDFTAEHLGI